MSHNPRHQPAPGPDCARYALLLPLLDVGELSGPEVANVRRHTDGCPWCQRQLAAYATVDSALHRHLRALMAEAPVHTEETIMQMSTRDKSEQSDHSALSTSSRAPLSSLPPWRRSLETPSRLIAAIAAVLVIALGVAIFTLFGYGRMNRLGPGTQQTTACAPNQISAHLPSGARVYDLQMVSPSEGWAIGSLDTQDAPGSFPFHSTALILHYSHCQWNQVPSSLPVSLLGISMLSSTEGWAVGMDDQTEAGVLLQYTNGQWQQATLPSFVGQQAIEDFQMISPTEGWMMITGGKDQQGNVLSSQIYHLQNGSWSLVTLPDQSRYQTVVFDGAFGPGEAWIEGDTNAFNPPAIPTPHLFLYRNGAITPMALPMPVSDNTWDYPVLMDTPQTGWLVVGRVDNSLSWLSRTLLHFDGTTWSQTAVLDDSRVQTAAKVQVFSGGEGMAFLTRPLSSNIEGGDPYPPITGALWLHNGKWQPASWPLHGIWGIARLVQVSPTEYWAIPYAAGSTPQSGQSAILHFENGVWTSYS